MRHTRYSVCLRSVLTKSRTVRACGCGSSVELLEATCQQVHVFIQVRALQLKRQTSELFLTPASSLTSLPDSAAAAVAQGVSGTALQVWTRLGLTFRMHGSARRQVVSLEQTASAPCCDVLCLR